MKPTGKKLTALMAGAVLLASTAYGIGSQTGDGGASAAGSSAKPQRDHAGSVGRRHHRHGAFGTARLARKLGVDEDKLTAALEEIRREVKPPGGREDGFAADLARELGVSQENVTKALGSLRPKMDGRRRGGHHRDGRHGRKMTDAFAADLAKALGLDADDVKAALEKLRKGQEAKHAARRTALAKALAAKLGIPVEKVLAALPARGPHGPGGPDGPPPGFRGPGGPPHGPDGRHGPGGPGGPLGPGVR